MEQPLLNETESIGGNESLQSQGGVGAPDYIDQPNETQPVTQASFSIQQPEPSVTRPKQASTSIVQYDMVDIYLPRPSIGRGDIEHTPKTGTIFSGCMNLSNTVMGAGILSLPYAVSRIGYGMAVILFILFACLTFCSLHLNMAMSRCVPNASYYTLSEAINKPRTKFIIDIAVIIGMMSAGTSYLIIIGDVMPSFCRHFFPSSDHEDGSIFSIGSLAISQRAFWTMIFLVFLILPSAMLKNMNALRHTSLFAMFCFAFITFVMVSYMSIESWDQCEDVPDDEVCRGDVFAFLDLSKAKNWLQFLEVTPFFLLAFGCAQNTLPISNEMQNRSLKKLNFVLLNTLSFVVSVYCLVGISGYVTYGDRVKPNILKLYPHNNYTAIVRLCMAICVAFSYPLVTFPARRSLSTLLFKCDPGQLSPVKFYGITFGFVLVTVIYAFSAKNIGLVFQISGSTAYPIKEYVFPAYTFMMMKHHKLEQDTWNNAKKKFAHFLFWFGILLIPFCLVMVFVEV